MVWLIDLETDACEWPESEYEEDPGACFGDAEVKYGAEDEADDGIVDDRVTGRGSADDVRVWWIVLIGSGSVN